MNEKVKFRPWGEIESYADSRSIFLDIDGHGPIRLREVWRLFRLIGDVPVAIGYSRSRRGWHVEVYSGCDYSPAEIVVLQLLLGSDSNRERFNFARIARGGDSWNGLKRWNILYRRKLE